MIVICQVCDRPWTDRGLFAPEWKRIQEGGHCPTCVPPFSPQWLAEYHRDRRAKAEARVAAKRQARQKKAS